MAKAPEAKSPEARAHLEWLGYVQPLGLVVSVPAMLEAQCYVNKNIMGEHNRFLGCLPRAQKSEQGQGDIVPEIRDFAEFTQQVLEWEASDLLEVAKQPDSDDLKTLEVVLPQYNETLRPTHVVPVFKPKEGENLYLLLVQQLATETDFDDQGEADSSRHWHATPQAKFERLLRETGVPIGLLFNGRQLRLVYSPRGETSGHATFNVDEMVQVAGRPMFAALHMLLSAERMFSLGDNQRLPAILQNSRKYQNTVSTALAEQVLAALYELMRGFQAANDVRQGELLKEVLANDPNHVYAGLLRVLMRLVFIMYAEDRDLLSSDPIYSNHYSVTGLFSRLREDAGRYPDTMNQRFGAWSQLITLFRLVYEGGQHDDFKLPGRKGYLFDPDRYPFLEGRQQEARNEETVTIPRVSDAVVFNVLQNLLILDGERLSYRTLDVEQIGSVYETVMGFNLEVATGKSIAIKPVKSHGAPATINLEILLETAGSGRAKWLKEHADQKLGAADAKLLKAAESIDELLTALDKKIAKKVTPRVVPSGAIVLQPSDERRRSGSHYTPRSLTEPIVRTTLEPILKQLVDSEAELPHVLKPNPADRKRYTKGELAERTRLARISLENAEAGRRVGTPHPSQILDLKVCDPAMGSGAFLVETCRQLGDELIKSWYAHDLVPHDIPPDEDEVLYARRLIAQRCLYGVDKNVMAVDLAKLSLWLVTLAKDHPFTFLDHCLRGGDSLVGLTRQQIIGFHWEPKKQKKFGEELIQRRLDRATEARAKILNAREDVPYRDQESRMALADESLNLIRLIGDVCVSAFFAGSKKKERESRCDQLLVIASAFLDTLKNKNQIDFELQRSLHEAAASLREGEHPLSPFHWEIEFPEVFSRTNGGFDAFVGNPPFLGGARIWANLGTEYPDWLREVHSNSTGKAVDLIAHFFRRTYTLIRRDGCLGLIATNTIAQGDSREAGLRQICLSGGTVYSAIRRLRWPGQAAVIVSVINVRKGSSASAYLDGKKVGGLNSFLFARSTEFAPKELAPNVDCCFRGCDIYGQGFVFSDEEKSVNASPIRLMRELVAENKSNEAVIFPYIGGKEINSHPRHEHHRYVVNFAQMSLEEANKWPKLIELVREKVKPERAKLGGYSVAERRRDYWWQYGTYTPALYNAIDGSERVLAISQTTKYIQFCFLPSEMVFSHKLLVLPVRADHRDFGLLQSRVHEIWALFLGSSMKDDPVYSPPDCFETFPFPDGWTHNPQLESSAKKYYEFRAIQFTESNEGMTETYNRFHSPDERDEGILELRRLHAAMDDAVLRAYGWDDLAETATCEFLLDYEEEEDNSPGAKKSKKKKPWRLRWPDPFRDEVLARLLELNEQRHQEELLVGQQLEAENKPKRKKAAKKPAKSKPKSKELALFSTTLDHEHRYLLILLREFDGRAVSRRVLNAAMILMLDDALRKALLSNGQTPAGNHANETTINQYFTDLSIDGFIEQLPSEHQQLWHVTASAPSTDDASAKDRQRVAEVMEFLNRETEAGNVTISEEVVDANVDLIPA